MHIFKYFLFTNSFLKSLNNGVIRLTSFAYTFVEWWNNSKPVTSGSLRSIKNQHFIQNNKSSFWATSHSDTMNHNMRRRLCGTYYWGVKSKIYYCCDTYASSRFIKYGNVFLRKIKVIKCGNSVSLKSTHSFCLNIAVVWVTMYVECCEAAYVSNYTMNKAVESNIM